MDKNSIENRLLNLSEGMEILAPELEVDHQKVGEQMIEEINQLENQIRTVIDPNLEYLFGIALRNYTAWFVRGDDRKRFLERAVIHLKKAAEMGSSDALIELTRILIEEKLVRDLDNALKIAGRLQQEKQLPEWLIPAVEKAKRWSGKIDIPNDSDFSELSATPAAIREERTKLRKILIDLVKSGNHTSGINVAKRLYNLGLLAAYLYGDSDGSSGVSGEAFDAADAKLGKVKNKFKFDYLGRITDANFLTLTDYNRIEKMMGVKERTLTTSEIQHMV